MADATMRFAEFQMDGDVDFKRFKRDINKMGRAKEDMARLQRFKTLAGNTRAFDESSPTSLVYQDGVDMMVRLFSGFFTGEAISTAVPAPWLMAREAVIGMNRLITMPDFKVDDDLPLWDTMVSCAFCLDALGRMADSRTRDEFAQELTQGIDDNYMFKHGISVLMDIVCGRGGAWLAYIDFMGEAACKLSSMGSWWQMRDQYGLLRSEEYAYALAKITGVDNSLVWPIVQSQVVLVSQFYSRMQAIMASGANKLPARIGNVESARMFPNDNALDMSGWCRIFGVSSIACTFNVPRGYEVQVRREIIEALESMKKAG